MTENIKYIRVTKYNPTFRDSKGAYQHDEWTEYTDLGREFNNVLFTFSEYKETEDKYLRAIEIFLKHSACTKLRITQLEKYLNENDFKERDRTYLDTFRKIENNLSIKVEESMPFLILKLRTYFWCVLVCEDCNAGIEFGYDYYMYFYAPESLFTEEFLNTIHELGLFAET